MKWRTNYRKNQPLERILRTQSFSLYSLHSLVHIEEIFIDDCVVFGLNSVLPSFALSLLHSHLRPSLLYLFTYSPHNFDDGFFSFLYFALVSFCLILKSMRFALAALFSSATETLTHQLERDQKKERTENDVKFSLSSGHSPPFVYASIAYKVPP